LLSFFSVFFQAEHKAKLLGEITLNLAEYCHKPLFNISTEYVLTDKKKMTDIKLHMSISAHWVKVDGKKYSKYASTITCCYFASCSLIRTIQCFAPISGEAVAQGDVADDDDTESEITHMSEVRENHRYSSQILLIELISPPNV
jgi:hypothetical protein